MAERNLQDLIEEYALSLELEENTILRALELLNRAEEKHLIAGKKVEGSIAALLYISGILEDNRRTQKQISKIVSVPESTIRNRYVEIVRELEITR